MSEEGKFNAEDSALLRETQGWLELGVPSEAFATLKKLSPDSPAWAASLTWRMSFDILEAFGDWKGLIATACAAIKINETWEKPHEAFAIGIIRMHGAEIARDYFLSGEDRLKNSPCYLAQVASCLVELGDDERAEHYMQRLSEVKPSFPLLQWRFIRLYLHRKYGIS